MRHIRSCQKQQGGGRCGKRPTSPPPLAAPRESPNCSKPEPDWEEATADLARMIALHGYDPSIVEDSYFRSFISRLNPDFQVPSRAAIEDICGGIFDEAERDFKSELVRTSGKVNLALDTAKTVDGSVLYVACHFIDEEWNRCEMIMNMYMVSPPFFVRHCPLLCYDEACLEDEDICVEVVVETIDYISHKTFSRTIGTIGDLEDHLAVSCYDATFVNTVLHSIAQCLFDNRASDFMDSELLFQRLTRQKLEELLSQLGLDDIREYDEQWYQWYCWLQVLHKYSPSSMSGVTKLMSKLLGEIYRAIKTISDPSRPTSNICLRELFSVREFLQSELAGASSDKATDYDETDDLDSTDDLNGFVVDVVGDVNEVMDTSIQDSYLVWSIPLVLDPRYKLRYIEFSFHRAFGSKAENYISKVTETIKELFTDYSEDDGETTYGDPNRIGVVAGGSADPLQQAWEEHCRLQGGMPEVAKTELDRYLEDHLVPSTERFDILNWWKDNSSNYPTVARMARAALAMPTCNKLSCEQISQIRSMVRGYSKEGWYI